MTLTLGLAVCAGAEDTRSAAHAVPPAPPHSSLPATPGQTVPMSREGAHAVASLIDDCRVTEVVDIRKGVRCMMPKAAFVNYRPGK